MSMISNQSQASKVAASEPKKGSNPMSSSTASRKPGEPLKFVDPVFTLKDVAVSYGNFVAVSDVNMQIPSHDITAFIGPSGCGKSTLLRTLNRTNDLIPGAKVHGSLFYHDADLYHPSASAVEVRRRIGMVFQKPNPFPSMTIGENVLSGLKLAQIKVENKDELLESCLVRAGLWNEVKDRLGAHGGSLSGGQQQRLCIARALAVSPQVLLMDEPCSALDPGSTLRIEETIRELSDSMTIIIVTHNMQQAARVSDYTAFFLSDGGPGEMIEVSRTSEIFSQPKDQRTENYVTGRFG
jgi:phosphate transport system ATP-binding protein